VRGYSAPVQRILHLCLTPLLLLVLVACPKTKMRTLPDVPTSGNARALGRFQEARARFERDFHAVPASEFEIIAREFPRDPVAPFALLYAGMAAVIAGDYPRAEDVLSQLEARKDADPALLHRGQLFHGIALNYQGKHREALPRLTAARDATADDRERGEWLAAMAEAGVASGQVGAALPHYDAWYRLGSKAEQSYIVERVRGLVANLDPAAARAAYERLEDKDGPAAAFLGARLAAELVAAGQFDAAEEVRDDTADARKRLGLWAEMGEKGGGDPGRVGALVPLTGRSARVGELVVRGLSLAAGSFPGAGPVGADSTLLPRPFALSVRDTGSVAARVTGELDAIAREGVIAVIGPADGKSVEVAGRRATELGLPLISLSPRAGGHETSPLVFHVIHTAEDRARALARHAYLQGVRQFAIFRPDSGYGRTVGRAFAEEVRRLGGTVTAEAQYGASATSFGDALAPLARPWQALFVPDQARRLELIAPALASADFVSLPFAANRPRAGRKMLLLSTAELATPGFVRSAGRYCLGAVLAPGFFPDRNHPRIAEFVTRYTAVFSREPTALDAYAFDAALAIRGAVEAGARSSEQLGVRLAQGTFQGVTGNIRFDASRERADDGVLFTVVNEPSGAYAVRALAR
jgi:ABC-type branched-subunit amino acid transport system substrate-binding protein